MTGDIFTLKIAALLHDPPHKPLVLGRDHAQIGRDLAQRIAGRPVDLTQQEEEAIRQADQVASGADRANFLRDLQVDPRRELTLIHPMDGASLGREKEGRLEFAEVSLSPEDVDAARALAEGPDLAKVFADLPADAKTRYLVLWRFLPDILRRLEGQDSHRLGALWEVLPADTRMPNHPVLVHNGLVAALAPILASGDRPALLRFAIGPVQPFIEAARSLADLWAGSYLLSCFAFEAMKVVIEEYGPDGILFPSLRGQPFLDQAILACLPKPAPSGVLQEVLDQAQSRLRRRLRTPSLPNVFVAVVPAEQAQTIVGKAEQALRQFAVETFQTTVANHWPDADPHTVIARGQEQWRDALEVHWAVAPWLLAVNPESWLQGAWPERVAHQVASVRAKTASLPGYRPNAGALYPVVSEQAAALLDAAKRDRLGPGARREEGGLKCTMCGEREVLGGQDFYEQRDLWRAMAQDRATWPWVRENDALCGVCFLKRIVGRGGALATDQPFRHPSTSEVATSAFKQEIIEKATEDERVGKAVQGLLSACERLEDRDEYRVHCVEAVHRAAGDDGLLREFANLDGAVLLPIQRGTEAWPREVLRARTSLWKTLQDKNITREPSPYLAVVLFDGDEIGKWLSGDKGPLLQDMIHPRARSQLGSDLQRLAGVRRPVTPAIHATISAICEAFAQQAAPWTIEREGLAGHLVYAGGDDALFLAPPLEALRLVWRLRLRFSGYPARIRRDEDPAWPDEVRPWFTTEDRRVLLAFGREATASAGMCVFHAKDPLGRALEEARKAEKRAKDEGRNALGVTVLRRSGQVSEAVIPFGPVVLDVLELARWFTEHRVSRSLGVLLASEFASIDTGADAKRLFEVARPLARRAVLHRLVEEGDGERLATLVERIGERLVQAGAQRLERWANLVGVAEFLARPMDTRES